MSVNDDAYVTDDAHGETWHLMLGDSCERLAEIPDDSIGLSVCSPPFASLYTYSPSLRDLGNCSARGEFLEHYGFVIREQLRVTRPGRNACVHVQQVATRKAVAGYIGLTDFRGEVIRAFQDAGCPGRGAAPRSSRAGWRTCRCRRISGAAGAGGSGRPSGWAVPRRRRWTTRRAGRPAGRPGRARRRWRGRVVSTADAGVVAWLRSPEGEEWSRSRALDRAEDDPVVCMQVLWRATGPLDARSDPCGWPAIRPGVAG